VLLVLPEAPDKLGERLGRWLKDHLQKRRNVVRFLLPRQGSTNLFYDKDVVILARASLLAQQWSGQSPDYGRLHRKYQGELRDMLKRRFDRFAVLRSWNFGDPTQCVFEVEAIPGTGGPIPEVIEQKIASDLFVPEDFEEVVLAAASESASLGKLLKELQEPRPGSKECIPWLGETEMKELILRFCARGAIAINVRGMEYIQAQAGEDEAAAYRRLKSKLPYSGRQLDEIFVLKPSAVPATGGAAATPGGLFGGGSPSGPGSATAPSNGGSATTPNGTGPSAPAGGNIFGGASGSKPRTPLSNPATSPLNLIGKLESWGVGPATTAREVTLKMPVATGAQLKELLKKLPDGMTYELSLEKEES
jgi:hypothetical protein